MIIVDGARTTRGRPKGTCFVVVKKDMVTVNVTREMSR